MPQLSDLVGKRKFVKKEYRPWDLSGTGTVDGKEKPDESVKPEVTDNLTDSVKSEVVDVKNLLVEEKKSILIEPPNERIEASSSTTDNKSGNDLDNKQRTISKQLDNVKITKPKQRDNIEVTNREQPGNVLDNIASNTEKLPYLIDSIKKLSGIQKNIFLYVINICSARGLLDTGNILSIDLANAANCSIGSAKTSLIRLIEKQLVLRLQGKASRGGHMVLGITKEIQSAAIQAQQALFNPLKMLHSDNIIGNVTNNMSSYSSSSIYKNNTTTTSLPETWKNINFESLLQIGFSETQLRQLYDSNKTDPEIVQDSINRFAYSLDFNDKVKAYDQPLNVLMGVLRKGQRWNEPKYLSPKELTLREMVEEKRQKKAKRDLLIKEYIELEFPDWKRKLAEEDINRIVPNDILKMKMEAPILSILKTYFIENVLLPKLEAGDI